MNNEQKKQAWQALQHFYKMKSVLLPEFMEKNRRNLGDIESKLIAEYEKKDEKMCSSMGCKNYALKDDPMCNAHARLANMGIYQ